MAIDDGASPPASPERAFLATEYASAAILLAATVVAVLWANSPWSGSYERFWGTEVALRFGDDQLALDLREWVNDGLMALFFFVVGLEIRRELDMGELRERRRGGPPGPAAVRGMGVGGAWSRVRTFLLTLVIVDDIGALLVIALAYTGDVSLEALAVAVGLYGVVLGLRAAGVRHGVPYFLAGSAMWLATLAAGVHAKTARVSVRVLA